MSKIKSFIKSKRMENCSENTISSYLTTLRQFLSINRKIMLSAVKKYINYLFNSGINPSSIRQKLACLREFYKFSNRQFPSIKIKVDCKNYEVQEKEIEVPKTIKVLVESAC